MAKDNLTKHHRKCKSNGGTDHPRNLSVVPCKKHEAWHLLFSNKEIEEIVELLNSVWIDPDYKLHFKRVN